MSLVGENIDAHCLKCKLVLAHIVLYEVGGVVSKVKCKTCGAEHKYRGAKPPAKKKETASSLMKEKRTKTKSSSGSPSINVFELWETRSRNMDPEKPVKDYRMQDQYQPNDVIQHPVFGLGFVEHIFSERRMDVLFRDALRSMAMNINNQ
ncbi:MAG: hypothetical protein PHN75_15775 [Syntrophales bacterium]|nr:hypothetical protein [Syntrophales bacterium]